MAKYRFYLPQPDWVGDLLELPEEEAHHCRDVMRCREGEEVILFDGRGKEATVRIEAISKQKVAVSVQETRTDAPLPARITLGQAIPKGKNMDLIIQKATELGAAQVVPLLTANTVVQLSEKDRHRKQQKWQRVAIEACKQCGQNWLPNIATPAGVAEFVSANPDPCKIVAAIDPRARTLKEILASREDRPAAASLLIGPEGDLTAEEVSTAIESGFLPLSLGPIILRSETAAIYSISVLVYELMAR